MSPLPDYDEDQRDRADHRQDDDEMRFEPIFALPFVENNLESPQAKGDGAETNVVDSSFTELAALEIGRILNEPGGEQNRNDADRDVDEKNPTPGEVVRDPATEGRSNGWCAYDGHAVNGEGHAAFGRRKRIGEDGLLAGLQSTSPGALQYAADDEGCKIRR